MSMKNPATFQFVAQHLNHCATAFSTRLVEEMKPSGVVILLIHRTRHFIVTSICCLEHSSKHQALLLSNVYLCYLCIAVFTLDAGLLGRSQYSEGPATGHPDTDFSWFPCVYKQMVRWFPKLQVVTTYFSRSPPDLNLLVTSFIFCIHVK